MIVLNFLVYVTYLIITVNSYIYKHAPNAFTYDRHTPPFHKYIATANDLPYHVLVAYLNLYCSGSLVRSKVVVTVASCFLKWDQQRIVVKVGSDTITGLGQVIEVVELKTHEYYSHTSILDNDIALLMLKDHVSFSNKVKKLIMIESDTTVQEGNTLDVSGWGSTELNHQSAKYANNLLRTEMTILSSNECEKHFPFLMSRNNFCARYPPERRIGDNGGGAVFKNLLVGLLSYGGAKTEEPYVALLTNVSYFNRWIHLNTVRFMKKYCLRNHVTHEESQKTEPNFSAWV